MKLKDLLKKLKTLLLIDDELRAYIYEYGYIEIIDHTDEIKLKDGFILDASNSTCLKICYNKKNVIDVIDHNFNIFTPANKDIVIQIANLINTHIEDLDNYPKIKSIDKLEYVKL